MYKHKIKFKSTNSKQNHRNRCIQLLSYIRTKDITNILISQYNETILVEFRILPHIEFIVKNVINLLDITWSHTIVCGNNNYSFIRSIFKNLPNIRIVKLDYTNLTKDEYNKLLYTIDFWNLFYGEKLLIYQEDSIMFHGNINRFLKYDYVGAPWPKQFIDIYPNFPSKGGNGGFSLRSKSKIIECLKKNGESSIPEDVYFSKYLDNICPRELSKEFSQEFVKGNKPIGGHCYWKAYVQD